MSKPLRNGRISEGRLLYGLIFVPFVAALSVVTFVALDAQSFRARTDLVQVTVAVTDSENRLITGLTKGDFQVFEDGDVVADPDDAFQAGLAGLDGIDRVAFVAEHGAQRAPHARLIVDDQNPFFHVLKPKA